MVASQTQRDSLVWYVARPLAFRMRFLVKPQTLSKACRHQPISQRQRRDPIPALASGPCMCLPIRIRAESSIEVGDFYGPTGEWRRICRWEGVPNKGAGTFLSPSTSKAVFSLTFFSQMDVTFKKIVKSRTAPPWIGWALGDFAPGAFHTTGHAVFRIRRLNPAMVTLV